MSDHERRTAVDWLILDELRTIRAAVTRLEAELTAALARHDRAGRCGAVAPGAGPYRSFAVCTLPAGHGGWHHDEQSGMEWGPPGGHDKSTGG